MEFNTYDTKYNFRFNTVDIITLNLYSVNLIIIVSNKYSKNNLKF